jgi:DNA repair protein RecN (Recombination protein N)
LIESIAIRNLGVIQQAELEFGSGFTALTGETGAGKTMVLSALGLLLGGRADSGAVRSGAAQLFVEGRWQLSGDFESLKARLAELGADSETGELLVNRSVSSEGRSRAAVGGASVPVAVLAELAEQLVAVHGQSDQLRLKSATAQREALDAFAGEALRVVKASYQQAFSAWRDTERRLERLKNSSETDRLRAVTLREFLNELERLNPQPGELDELISKLERMSNIEALRAEALAAHEALSSDVSDVDAITLLGLAKKQLEASSDPQLRALATGLVEATELARDSSRELASYLATLDLDPAQLEQLQQRRADLTQFTRKHQRELDELIASAATVSAELIDLDSGDDQLERLEQLAQAQLSQLGLAAKELSTARTVAAQALAQGVSEELSALAMGGSSLSVSVTQQDFEAHGADKIEFLLAPHPGAEPRPLGKGASGGELSRVMLAIELVLAGNGQLPTMIFDEVDAGVGGAAALELGRRLRKLSESTQVIVVTHLPQVAAFADTQLRVSKDSSGGFTASSVEQLEGEARVLELARMLSGNPDSDVARSHARELLAQS